MVSMSSIYSKLINFILEHEGEEWFSAREFAEKHNFNYHTTRKYLEELANTGYLERIKQGKVIYYRLINPHKLAEHEKELARRDMFKVYREEIERLRNEIKKLRFLLSQYNDLIDEETLRRIPDDPITAINTEKNKQDEHEKRLELIMELLYRKFCERDLIRVKPKPEPEI